MRGGEKVTPLHSFMPEITKIQINQPVYFTTFEGLLSLKECSCHHHNPERTTVKLSNSDKIKP
jgi:hypothetical protein